VPQVEQGADCEAARAASLPVRLGHRSTVLPLSTFLSVGIIWLKNRKPSEWRDVQNHEHVLGRYIISDRPMTEEEWIRERATVIDVTPEK
jgi:hypothetical protein